MILWSLSQELFFVFNDTMESSFAPPLGRNPLIAACVSKARFES